MTAWKASGIVLSCFVGLLCLAYGATSAYAHSRYIFMGSFGEAGSGAGQLSLTAQSGVAVNSQTHDVYVADTLNNRIDEFEADGAFVRAWGWGVVDGAAEFQVCTSSCQKGLPGTAPGQFEAPAYLAVDNSVGGGGDVYVAELGGIAESRGGSVVSKFDKDGKLVEGWGVKGQFDGSSAPEGPFVEESTGFGGIIAIAVDPTGNLWVSARTTKKNAKVGNSLVYEFGQAGDFLQDWGIPEGGELQQFAVDSADNVYGNFEQDRVARYDSSGKLLDPISFGTGRAGEVVEVDGYLKSGFGVLVTGLAADPTTNNIYVEDDGSVERFASSCESSPGEFLSPNCVPLESFGLPQSEDGAGLAVDSGTGVVYVLKPGADGVEVFAPEVHRPPTVESGAVAAVTSDSATFSTAINPNGPDTAYRIEYGLSAAYGMSVPVPDGSVGSGFETQEFSLHVQGLTAQAIYHYRVAAYNEKGTTYSEDATFTTQSPIGGSGLPDGRQWELVTPAEKRGALFFGQNYSSLLGVVPNPLVGEASVNGDAMIDLASAPTEAQPDGYIKEVSVLSTRGVGGWSSQVIAPPRDKAAGAYLSEGGEYEFFSEDLSRGVVDPFGPFTALSPDASEATPYLHTDYLNGNVNERCGASCDLPLVTRADTQSGVSFGGEAEPGAGCPGAVCGPAFVAGTPDASHIVVSSVFQLTVTPNEKEGGRAETPSYYEWGDGRLQPLYLLPEDEGGFGVYAGELSSARHQLADDGSVFFAYREHLYMHDFAGDASTRLDAAQGVAEPPVGGASFLYASSDGSRVLFSDSKQLTSTGQGGIYECRIVETSGVPACELELTGLPTDTLIGGSKDASYLYFEDSTGHLIVAHEAGGEWAIVTGPYIGSLPDSSVSIAGFPTRVSVSEVSPDGRWLTLMSEEDLTGYDNHDAVSGRPDVEVYLYNATSNKLVCASCNPTGGRPVGIEYNEHQLVAGSVAEIANGGVPRWVASNLPPWTKSTHAEYRYQPRFLSDNGRLFFDSRDALVPGDVNGAQDVYEWEPPGVGDCSSGSVGYSERSGGCVSLISSGASAEESAFMDASGSGGDVFFITLAKLTGEDFDNALDVYDAHECSSTSPCVAPVGSVPAACSTGDACKAAPTPQPAVFGAPPSATFSGVGNVTPSGSPVVKSAKRKVLTRSQKLARALRVCAKKRHGARAVCERAARRHYGKVSSRGKRG